MAFRQFNASNEEPTPTEAPVVVEPSPEEATRLEARRVERESKERERAAPEPTPRLQDNPQFQQRAATEVKAYEDGHRTRQSKLDEAASEIVRMLKAEGVTDDHAIVKQATSFAKLAKDVLNEHHADGKGKAGYAAAMEALASEQQAIRDAFMESIPQPRRPAFNKAINDAATAKGIVTYAEVIEMAVAERLTDFKKSKEYQEALDEEYREGLRAGEKGSSTASSGTTLTGTAAATNTASDDAKLMHPDTPATEVQAILKRRGLA